MILIVYPTASICCKKREKEKQTSYTSSDGFDVWPQHSDHFVNCQRLWHSGEADTHTHPVGSEANLRGSLHWPRPDKVPVDETSFISSCCCSLGAEAATNQLKDSGAKRWKPRSTEPQAWSKGMRPGLGEAAELIGPAARLWWRR